MTVALVGNPNCGKSTLFNVLTGSRETTGNRAGVTFAVKESPLKSEAVSATVADLPGLYSLTSDLREEREAKKFLTSGRVDVVLNIIDASNLERGLFLTLQLLSVFPRVIVALNMMDEARRDGTVIRIDELSRELGVPVVPISAAKKEGIRELMAAISHSGNGKKPFLTDETCAQEAARIAGKCAVYPPGVGVATDRIDRVLCRPIIGIPLFFLLLFFTFSLAFSSIGKGVQTFLVSLTDSLASLCIGFLSSRGVNAYLLYLLEKGVFGGVSAVLSFLPQTVTLFFLLELMEESGYTARASYVMDRVMRAVGLSGKAFVPVIIGFGCTVPAVMACETLDAAEHKRILYSLPFISCSARFPVILLFSSLFPQKIAPFMAFFLYFAGILVFILSCLLFSRKKEPPPSVVMELPRFRVPAIRNVFRTVSREILHFLSRSGSIVFLSSLLVTALTTLTPRLTHAGSAEESLLSLFGKILSPVTVPLGFSDYRLTGALLSGFFAKESIVAAVGVLFENGLTLPTPTAFSFSLFSVLYLPCAATVSAWRSFLTRKEIAFGVFRSFLIAYLFTFAVSGIVFLF
ncbi:MAG: ferrous iron transporter B [Ruminococcus sp.]|nr:ferrous iron transporter B [Candidatus Apopatosoma intestinale]